jgi:hypothetical protein
VAGLLLAELEFEPWAGSPDFWDVAYTDTLTIWRKKSDGLFQIAEGKAGRYTRSWGGGALPFLDPLTAQCILIALTSEGNDA